MEPKILNFVWRYSWREQLLILLLTICSFPLVYASLEVPKIIINDAISGDIFPKSFFGIELEQIEYLMALSFLFMFFVLSINGIKWLMNVLVGLTGERLLRRMRYTLFEHVMRSKIARFKTNRSGEIIQSIMGEIEPLGGFFGEIIATPIFQGGLLFVYATFIFMQDWVLGLAAVSLYPFQAFLIPKLQAKIIRLNRRRAANNRQIADTIGEAVSVIPEVHTNDTAHWHMAQAAGQLYKNTVIRLQIFKRKFTIKIINNFINQLTPFLFYSLGGYLVIKGDLDFGSLVAVLAAYKDVASPWKEVLNYAQRSSDFASRYSYVVESFSDPDMLSPAKPHALDDQQRLSGALKFEDVSGGPALGGLTVPSLQIRPGEMVAVCGGDGGAREAMLKMAAALERPVSGDVSVGDRSLAACSIPELGRSIAYVGQEPGIVARSLRDNLLYGLFSRPPDLADANATELRDRLREARLTGNTTADPNGDWVDYEAAGLSGPEELEKKLLELIASAGLSSDVYSAALNGHLATAQSDEVSELILKARQKLRDDAPDLSDLIEEWAEDRLNWNGSLLENVLYALPAEAKGDISEYAKNPNVVEALDACGATPLMADIGLDIAVELAALAEILDDDSDVLLNFSGFERSDIRAACDLMADFMTPSAEGVTRESEALLIRLAVNFVPMRDRFEVLTDVRIEKLLQCRTRARAQLKDNPRFVALDSKAFMPGRSIGGNVLHGKRRFDRRARWNRLDGLLEEVIIAVGLREQIIRIGLSQRVGVGAPLSTSFRRRIGLVRGLIKAPHLLVLDGVAGSTSNADASLRRVAREAAPDSIILYAATETGAETDADFTVELGYDGSFSRRDRQQPPR